MTGCEKRTLGAAMRWARWLASILSVGGALLVALHLRAGFHVWAVSNLLWIFLQAQRRDWPQVIMWLVYLATAQLGLIVWD